MRFGIDVHAIWSERSLLWPSSSFRNLSFHRRIIASFGSRPSRPPRHSNREMSVDCFNPGCAAQGTKRCAGCLLASYCSPLCQKENWPVHKKTCSSIKKKSNNDPIPCVRLGAQAGGPSAYRKTTIPSNDDIFNQAPAPISQRFGFPLILRRTKPASQYSTRSANDDNPHATWLMIDPDHGFAPSEWQSGVGDVLVVRADRKPLDITTLAIITDFVSDILDAFGDGMEGDEVARKYYRKERLVTASNGRISMQD